MIATLSSAAACMQGRLVGEDREFAGISTDTRSLVSGQLFFALQGPNFNGEHFVGAARDRGAAGAVVATRTEDDIAQIQVDDARLALGRFASAWRNEHDVTVIGLTGSNGKTTLKELVAACLGHVAPTLATEGNLNNDIGVPLMMARIAPSHRFAVLEMGANHAGEIAYLASLARPDIVAITNAGPAHLEGFGSLDGVARAKGEILQDKVRPRVAVLNADDPYFGYWCSLVGDVRCISFGLGENADVRAVGIDLTPHGSQFTMHVGNDDVAVTLPLSGIHNVRNACAAAAVAHALGVPADDIRQGLQDVRRVGGRLEPLPGAGGATLFDDSYNANPVSVAAAAEFLAALPGENWLVLGDMKELGDDAAKLHREVGEAARTSGIDRLFAFGDLARNAAEGFGNRGRTYATLEALIDDLEAGLGPDVNVLVKGSRSMRMERVVAALRDTGGARSEA